MSEVSFVSQSFEILDMTPDPVGAIARAARTCYRSEASASPESDARLVQRLIERGHEAMVEHAHLTVLFTTDRGVSHEIVRHRLFSFAQESTRYVNYGDRGFRFILPDGLTGSQDVAMRLLCEHAARGYETLLRGGCTPEVARSVLPNATATQIVVTGNLREWRHALRLRTERHAHPQIRALMTPLLAELRGRVPIVFDDIEVGE